MINPSYIESQTYEAQANLLKVLTHPARLAILEILRDGEHCVCHIEAHLGLRQAYISQQLAVLRESGLIQDRRDGWNVYYRVIEPGVYEVLSAVRRLIAVVSEAYTEPEAQPDKAIRTQLAGHKLHSAIHCPCPKCNTGEEG